MGQVGHGATPFIVNTPFPSVTVDQIDAPGFAIHNAEHPPSGAGYAHGPLACPPCALADPRVPHEGDSSQIGGTAVGVGCYSYPAMSLDTDWPNPLSAAVPLSPLRALLSLGDESEPWR